MQENEEKEIGEELGQETSRREKVNEKVWFTISKNAERAGKKIDVLKARSLSIV